MIGKGAGQETEGLQLGHEGQAGEVEQHIPAILYRAGFKDIDGKHPGEFLRGTFLQEHGNIPDEEMRRVFNMGIGYCVIVNPAFADSVREKLEKLGETVFVMGEVKKGTGQVREK